MKKAMMMLGAVLAWVIGGFAATHEGVQLWENGPLWAKTNVGANSPTETGYYFWWGDTLGYKWQNNQWVASDGSKTGFSFSAANVPTNGKTLSQLQTMGVVGADGSLLPAYDAAAKQWGDDWRMPKASEYRNLIELCTWSWATNNNVIGYNVTGKGLYSANSIFIPVCGYGATTDITSNLTTIYLWTSSSDANTSGRPCFTSTSKSVGFNTGRSNGYPIRPVKSLAATKQSVAVALDTRTGTRTVAAKESIAYDAAWGEAASGTLTVNGSAVSGLSKTGTYAWTPNTSATNFWKLAYKAGTANYSATFQSLDKYTITYAETKGAENTNPTQYNILDSITFKALPNVTGYTFKGWNPTKIAAGGFGAKTVTAQWTPITYSVKFNVNGGTGTMANESFTYDTAKTLTANVFKRTGYTFKGWATSSGATSVAYADKASVKNLTATAGGTVNLYAVWQANAYTVKFNANGGSGTTAQVACTYDQNATLTANAFTRAGFAFVGWATSASGSVAYTDKQSVKNLSATANATVNLYAKWTDTWYVNAAMGADTKDGASAAQPFKTIQHAIDKAVDGMTIIVADGTYAPINSGNKPITIRSVNGVAKTIIDAGKTAMCARLANWSATASMTNTILHGFTLQNGYSSLDAGGAQGGTLQDCYIVSNRAARTGGGTCYSALYNCVVEGNSSGNLAGGAYSPTAYDCTFVGNMCATNGGGVCAGVLVDCTVISNRAERDGGGAYNAVLTNCVVQSNTALNIGGGIHRGILYSCVASNNTSYVSGGGVYDSTSTRCTIVDNRAYNNGGGVHGGSASDCVIAHNVATQAGGGVCSATLNRCIIRENSAGGNGGGAFLAYASNCLFVHNTTAATGGGVHKGVLNNCTVYGNVAKNSAGGVDGVGGLTEVSTNNNCIVWGNSANEYPNIEPSKMVLRSCYTDDPHFVNVEAGDFRLRYDSPCIDAGDNAYVTSEVDFAGNQRIVNGTVDIGAYEYDAALDTKFSVQVTDGTGGGIYYESDAVTVSATAKTGYTFKEWTGVAADVALLAEKATASTTFAMPGRAVALTATFRANIYTIIYDANGGSGTMTATDCEYDKEQKLASNQFVRVGYRFVGWAVAEGGDSTVADGATVKNLTSEDNGVVKLYAVWEKEKVADPIVSPANGAVFKTESCTVTITTETEGAEIYYTTNGRTPRVTEANRYKGAFTISDTATIVAVAVKGDSQSEYVEVTITKVIPEPLTLAGVLDEPKLAAVATGGDAEWLPIDDATAKVGGSCAVSGALDDNGEEESTWLEAKVYGKGTLTFWWRVGCEPDPRGRYTYDFATFEADGEAVVQKDGEFDWVQVTKTFTTDGEHVIRWIYNTDGWPSDDYDGCVWVDGVTWSGAAEPEESPKPTIVGDEGATVTGDAEKGFVVKPSDGKTAVEVTIPQGVDAAKVTVEVSPKVTTVKPNGAKVKIVSGGADITGFLNMPAADGSGVVDLTKATVRDEIVKEVLDVKKGAVIELSGGSQGTASPTITTAPTRVGLLYTFSEGRTIGEMERSASKPGDGQPWSPEIKVKGGNSAFYSIGVGKGE